MNLFLLINTIKFDKIFTSVKLFIDWYDFFLPFFYLIMKIKNLKISEDSHKKLKRYCDQHGIIIYKFLEKLIDENCKVKKDIYGED